MAKFQPLEAVPCDFPAPNRRSVELDNGKYYTREWKEGEKQAYTKFVLTKTMYIPESK